MSDAQLGLSKIGDNSGKNEPSSQRRNDSGRFMLPPPDGMLREVPRNEYGARSNISFANPWAARTSSGRSTIAPLQYGSIGQERRISPTMQAATSARGDAEHAAAQTLSDIRGSTGDARPSLGTDDSWRKDSSQTSASSWNRDSHTLVPVHPRCSTQTSASTSSGSRDVPSYYAGIPNDDQLFDLQRHLSYTSSISSQGNGYPSAMSRGTRQDGFARGSYASLWSDRHNSSLSSGSIALPSVHTLIATVDRRECSSQAGSLAYNSSQQDGGEAARQGFRAAVDCNHAPARQSTISSNTPPNDSSINQIVSTRAQRDEANNSVPTDSVASVHCPEPTPVDTQRHSSVPRSSLQLPDPHSDLTMSPQPSSAGPSTPAKTNKRKRDDEDDQSRETDATLNQSFASIDHSPYKRVSRARPDASERSSRGRIPTRLPTVAPASGPFEAATRPQGNARRSTGQVAQPSPPAPPALPPVPVSRPVPTPTPTTTTTANATNNEISNPLLRTAVVLQPNDLQEPASVSCRFNVTCMLAPETNPRKIVSHFLGRNKVATKRIPPQTWIMMCRKHYQRSRYHFENNSLWASVQADILIAQVNACRRDMGEIGWTIEWCSGVRAQLLRIARRRELQQEFSVPDATVKHELNETEMPFADRFSRLCGKNKTTQQVISFVTALKDLFNDQSNEVRRILPVEFLPVKWGQYSGN